MYSKKTVLVAVLLVVCLLAGCMSQSAPTGHTDPVSNTETAPTSVFVTEAVTEAPTVAQIADVFAAYEISVRSPKLAIHSGPGYSYSTTDYITDKGIYTIIAHEIEHLAENQQTTWGKLKSGVGWINLEDALAGDTFESYLFKIENPSLCVYSGPGYHYDYRRTIDDKGTYTIIEESMQYFSSGRYITWGKLKSGAGWICLEDAKIDIPDPVRCTACGRSDVYISRYALCNDCYNRKNAANGQCEHCGTYFPVKTDDLRCQYCYYCEVCSGYVHAYGYAGADSMVCINCRDTVLIFCVNCGMGAVPINDNGLCEFCAAGICTECGGPLGEDHNCDDYPNVFCPNCDWSMFTTGVGLDGFTCPDCGTHFMP